VQRAEEPHGHLRARLDLHPGQLGDLIGEHVGRNLRCSCTLIGVVRMQRRWKYRFLPRSVDHEITCDSSRVASLERFDFSTQLLHLAPQARQLALQIVHRHLCTRDVRN
jgi:hypothetical protein